MSTPKVTYADLSSLPLGCCELCLGRAWCPLCEERREDVAKQIDALTARRVSEVLELVTEAVVASVRPVKSWRDVDSNRGRLDAARIIRAHQP